MKNIAKIITILGGVKGLYASIDNAPYMRLGSKTQAADRAANHAVSVTIISNKTAIFVKTPRWSLS